jgi:hypothetical protein
MRRGTSLVCSVTSAPVLPDAVRNSTSRPSGGVDLHDRPQIAGTQTVRREITRKHYRVEPSDLHRCHLPSITVTSRGVISSWRMIETETISTEQL